MPKVSGQAALRNKLNKLAEGLSTTYVEVGYTDPKAIYVHEDLEAQHEEGKRAKYLEGPARLLRADLGRIIRQRYKETKSWVKALFEGGKVLYRESQEVVPVDTGELKASGYVAMEGEAELKAQEAYARSQAIARSASGKHRKRLEKLAKAKLGRRAKAVKAAERKVSRRTRRGRR